MDGILRIITYLIIIIAAATIIMLSALPPRSTTPTSTSAQIAAQETAEPATKPTKTTPWLYSTDIPGGITDEMTGKEIRYAATTSTNSHDLHWPYGNGVTATLRLRKHPRYGKDVIIELTAGQILCDSYDGCQISVRFDEKPMQIFIGSPPSDHANTTIFLSGYVKFVKATRAAQKVTVEIPLYQDGNRAFTFNVSGLEWKN